MFLLVATFVCGLNMPGIIDDKKVLFHHTYIQRVESIDEARKHSIPTPPSCTLQFKSISRIETYCFSFYPFSSNWECDEIKSNSPTW